MGEKTSLIHYRFIYQMMLKIDDEKLKITRRVFIRPLEALRPVFSRGFFSNFERDPHDG